MPRLYVLLEPCNEASTFMAPLCPNASPKMYWEMGKLLITLQSKLIGALEGDAMDALCKVISVHLLPFLKDFEQLHF
jgi:hypothetical protein